MDIVERFLKYVSFCTTSDENTNMTPSTPGQMEFARFLADELKSIGLKDVSLDSNGYIMATLPANDQRQTKNDQRPVIGFIAHMDTSPDVSGRHVKPSIVKAEERDFIDARYFERLKEADQHPVYYHCYGGADRTGTLGFLINGLLGVSYSDLVIDFELTSYSSINNEHIRCHIPGHQHQYDRWPALINQLQTDTTGGYAYDANAPLKDNIENFLVKACSVPQATIDTIRDIMLED